MFSEETISFMVKEDEMEDAYIGKEFIATDEFLSSTNNYVIEDIKYGYLFMRTKND